MIALEVLAVVAFAVAGVWLGIRIGLRAGGLIMRGVERWAWKPNYDELPEDR